MEEQRETSDGRDVAVICMFFACTSTPLQGEAKPRVVPGLPFVPHTASAAQSLAPSAREKCAALGDTGGANEAAIMGWVWGLAWLAAAKALTAD